MGPTVGEALVEFRKANGLTAEDASQAWWACQLGPISIRLPNFKWRQQAILAHDLHHVLTGYPCGMRGEFEIAAWEFGAGPMPHWGATLFCLPLIIVGLCLTPRRVLRAFLVGRQSRSLHKSESINAILAAPLLVARASLVSVALPDFSDKAPNKK
jgi:hypothetical protein